MPFRRSREEKAARRAAKEERKAELRERLRGPIEERRREDDERRRAALMELLEPDEEVELLLQTAEAVMKKFVCMTPKRLLLSSVHDTKRADSIMYRAINGYSTSNFITKDLALDVAGRRDKLTLQFRTEEERQEAIRVLQTHIS